MGKRGFNPRGPHLGSILGAPFRFSQGRFFPHWGVFWGRFGFLEMGFPTFWVALVGPLELQRTREIFGARVFSHTTSSPPVIRDSARIKEAGQINVDHEG